MASIIAIEKNGVVYMGTDAVKERCDVKYYMTKVVKQFHRFQ